MGESTSEGGLSYSEFLKQLSTLQKPSSSPSDENISLVQVSFFFFLFFFSRRKSLFFFHSHPFYFFFFFRKRRLRKYLLKWS